MQVTRNRKSSSTSMFFPGALKTCSSNLFGWLDKKGHCWWREGRRHLGQLLQSGESFRKICSESSEDSWWWRWNLHLLFAGNHGWVGLGGFSNMFFLKTNVMLLPVAGSFWILSFIVSFFFAADMVAFRQWVGQAGEGKGRTEGGQYSHRSLLRLLTIFSRSAL